MKLTEILLKLFPYLAGFICSLAIIIFVLVQMPALGWYAILTTLIVVALLIWVDALKNARIDCKISRDEVRMFEDRLQSIEDDIFDLRSKREIKKKDNQNKQP